MTRFATVEDLFWLGIRERPLSARDWWLVLNSPGGTFAEFSEAVRRAEKDTVNRARAFDDPASIAQWFGFLGALYVPDPLSFIGAAANEGR